MQNYLLNLSDMTSWKWNLRITAMTSETEVVDALTDGDKGTIITAKTPFYATMGGQEADKGVICTEDGEFVVEDVVKLAGGKIGHIGQGTKGMIKVGDQGNLKVDAKRIVHLLRTITVQRICFRKLFVWYLEIM